MASSWDNQRVNDDGTVSGSYYISDIDYATAYELWMAEPQGDKDLDARIYRIKNTDYLYVGDKAICVVPINWARISSKIGKQGMACEAFLQWRKYDDPQRFMVKVNIRNV